MASNIEAEVLVIGGGFGGVYALWKFRQMGLGTKLIEAGSFYGGTWHWNRYPGARVDSETPYYQLSIPEVYKGWTYTERFPGHAEIREYFKHVDKILGLSKDTYFNTIVTKCDYLDNKWHLQLDNGGTAQCKYLILATGSSYKKHFPDFKDMDKYRGSLIHSAMFPEGGVDVKGKKVAVIGNGATGIQIVQELAKEDCELTNYIRTPNVALPMYQRKISDSEQNQQKLFYDMYLKGIKATRSGFPYNTTEASIWDVPEDKRNAYLDEIWNQGGFAFLISNYRDFLTDKEANKKLYDYWASKTQDRIKDPVKRDIVVPPNQPQYFGTKRHSLEQDYYESLDRPNVSIVDMKKTPLSHFTEKGIVSGDEEREYDIIILATGYDFLTGSLLDLNLTDTSGRTLSEKWKKGIYTHLGLMIPGMPNAFMVYSPQAPTSLANGPPIIEIQVDWIAEAVKKMKEDGIVAVDGQEEAADKWRRDIQEMNEKTLFPCEYDFLNCGRLLTSVVTDSWYMGANVPGKVREQLIYLAGVDVYAKEIKDALQDWKGFNLVR
jgi:cation diffusion facilitator CzcD-associated flavoprotein CzcO